MDFVQRLSTVASSNYTFAQRENGHGHTDSSGHGHTDSSEDEEDEDEEEAESADGGDAVLPSPVQSVRDLFQIGAQDDSGSDEEMRSLTTDFELLELSREGSLMENLLARINEGHEGDKSSVSCKTPTTYKTTVLPPKTKLSAPFWFVVACPIILTFFGTTLATFMLFYVKQHEDHTAIFQSIETASTAQRHEMDKILRTHRAISFAYSLDDLADQIQALIVELPDRAVDGLWNTMRAYRRFGVVSDGLAIGLMREDRWKYAYPMWSEVSGGNPLRVDVLNRCDGLFLAFKNNAFTAVTRRFHGPSGHFVWYEAGESPLGAAKASMNKQYLDLYSGEPDATTLETKDMDAPTRLPFYDIQERLASNGGPAVQAWSAVHNFDNAPPIIFWTSPVSFCGNYSCFEGVLAAGVTLQSLSSWCLHAWELILDRLRKAPYHSEVSNVSNSAIFIVSQNGSDLSQQGLLLGWNENMSSDVFTENLTKANETEISIIRVTAEQLLQRFHTWDNASLLSKEQTLLVFSPKYGMFIENISDASADGYCNRMMGDSSDDDCYQVATRSVELDFQTRWLAVVVLPLGAFSDSLQKSADQAQKALHDAEDMFEERWDQLRVFMFLLSVVVFIVIVCIGVCLGTLLSRDVRGLRTLIKQLSRLDFSNESHEFRQLREGVRSRIKDVRDLQNAFLRLACSVKAFARFVPETVVRNIVRGNTRMLRLHVERREVTVLFSDVRDFTTISESLTQTQLLVVLTKYLTVMTEIVEAYGGVVTEILGDGVLAFWNTPDDVEDHATKACQAALAQQRSLVKLNEEFSEQRLPQLAIRIGIHTGVVLSGNLGSLTKMKFGCMGDPVNLASRLEGLCKAYGVGVICSGTTEKQLSKECEFLVRMLDVVLVKGKKMPTEIFEVMGVEDSGAYHVAAAKSSQTPATRSRTESWCTDVPVVEEKHMLASLYRKALEAWRAANFPAAVEFADQALRVAPRDTAAQQLRERALQQQAVPMTAQQRAAWDGVVKMTEK